MKINRFCNHHTQGTFGELHIDGEFFCYTVEKPWKDNERFISCVPDGKYILTRYDSDRYGDTFCLVNPDNDVYMHDTGRGRYACLVHTANFASDVMGCIGLGESLASSYNNDISDNSWMVTRSKDTVNKFLDMFSRVDEIPLTINWTIGG